MQKAPFYSPEIFFKKLLQFRRACANINKLKGNRVWRSLVSRLNGVQEAAGSSPVTRTIKTCKRMFAGFFFFNTLCVVSNLSVTVNFAVRPATAVATAILMNICRVVCGVRLGIRSASSSGPCTICRLHLTFLIFSMLY